MPTLREPQLRRHASDLVQLLRLRGANNQRIRCSDGSGDGSGDSSGGDESCGAPADPARAA